MVSYGMLGITPEEYEKLNKQKHTCCICGREFTGIGYDPRPVHPREKDGHLYVCCEACYNFKVHP